MSASPYDSDPMNHEVLFTDPTNPDWTMINFCGSTLVFHGCNEVRHDVIRRMQKGHHDTVSDDACKYCMEEPPPGFIALYKLYTWDK